MRFELLTPPGVGGVAVLAVRGTDREALLSGWLRAVGGGAFAPAEGRPQRAVLAPDGRPLDDVLVVDRPADGLLELHVHGSPAVLAVLQTHGKLEAAPAAAGLSGVPAVVADLLVRARTRHQLALALEQVGGGPLEEWLRTHGASVDAASRRRLWGELEARSRVARALATPCPLFLVGRQNAGKSTLFNRLVQAERALTGDLPGLTRDPVSEEVELAGYPYQLADTAGHGEAAGELDRAAIERGSSAARAGLRILVIDGEVGYGAIEEELASAAALVVWTRRDRVGRPRGWPEGAALGPGFDLRDESGALQVRAALGAALREVRALPTVPEDGVGGPVAWDDDELGRARRVLRID